VSRGFAKNLRKGVGDTGTLRNHQEFSFYWC
jgi:hypothetical protein